jgi:hypothetical protein
MFTVGSFSINANVTDPPFFEDDIILIEDSEVWITSSDLVYYNVSGTTALAALAAAARIGGFEYVVDDEWVDSFGLFVSEIAGQANEGMDGWQYWVNYPDEDIPMDAAEDYELQQGDTLDWFYGGYGISPDSSTMDIKLHIIKEEDSSPPTVDIMVPKQGGIYVNGRELIQLPLPFSIVLGQLNMMVTSSDVDTNIFKVSFLIDDIVKTNDIQTPYTFELSGHGSGLHVIAAQSYDGVKKTTTIERSVLFLSN